MQKEPFLALQHVQKQRPGMPPLNVPGLVINAGDIVGVLEHNGDARHALLALCDGQSTPSSGSIGAMGALIFGANDEPPLLYTDASQPRESATLWAQIARARLSMAGAEVAQALAEIGAWMLGASALLAWLARRTQRALLQ